MTRETIEDVVHSETAYLFSDGQDIFRARETIMDAVDKYLESQRVCPPLVWTEQLGLQWSTHFFGLKFVITCAIFGHEVVMGKDFNVLMCVDGLSLEKLVVKASLSEAQAWCAIYADDVWRKGNGFVCDPFISDKLGIEPIDFEKWSWKEAADDHNLSIAIERYAAKSQMVSIPAPKLKWNEPPLWKGNPNEHYSYATIFGNTYYVVKSKVGEISIYRGIYGGEELEGDYPTLSVAYEAAQKHWESIWTKEVGGVPAAGENEAKIEI